MVGSVITLAGGFLGAFATSIPQFIGGRVLVGAGQAFHQAVAPPLLQELAHPRVRGICGASRCPVKSEGRRIRADDSSVSWSFLCMLYRSEPEANGVLTSVQVGSILSAFLTLGMINWDSEWAWRFPTLLQIIGTVVISAYILAGLSELRLSRR